MGLEIRVDDVEVIAKRSACHQLGTSRSLREAALWTTRRHDREVRRRDHIRAEVMRQRRLELVGSADERDSLDGPAPAGGVAYWADLLRRPVDVTLFTKRTVTESSLALSPTAATGQRSGRPACSDPHHQQPEYERLDSRDKR